LKDEVKSYWNRRPCNVRHSSSPVGTEAYFNEVEERKYFVEPHIPGFADFGAWRGKRVLEIGCGIGTDAVNFVRGGADYTGIDYSEASVNLARQRFQVLGLTDGQLEVGDGEALPPSVAEKKFDLVYSFGVIHHTPSPRTVVENVRKVLKDDGEFRLMIYARNSWKSAMIAAGLDQPEAQFGCPIAYTYSPEQATELLEGFEILEMRQDHIFPYVVEKYVKYEYEMQPWFRSMPPEMFRALETSLGWHLLIRCRKKA
jgi:SAM-dependent methyltransferase